MYTPYPNPPEFSQEALKEEIDHAVLGMMDILCGEEYVNAGINGIVDIIEPVFKVGTELIVITIVVTYELGSPVRFTILSFERLALLN